MRYLNFSDLHLKPESASTCWVVLDKLLEQIEEQKPDTVLFGGDWYHNRYTIPADILDHGTRYIVKIAQKCPVILIPGNHDQYDALGNNALSVWSEIENVMVPRAASRFLDDEDADVLLMPWAEPAVQREWLAADPAPVVFGHAQVLGAAMNNLMLAPSGLTHDTFADRALCVLGHFHKPQSWNDGRLVYTGSPYQTRSDEAMQQKRFLVIDTAGTPSFREIPIDIGPKFFNVTHENAAAVLPQVRPGVDIVRAKAMDVSEQAAIQEAAHAAGTDVNIALMEAASGPRYGLPAGTSADEYARTWVEQHADPADRERLIALWEEMRG